MVLEVTTLIRISSLFNGKPTKPSGTTSSKPTDKPSSNLNSPLIQPNQHSIKLQKKEEYFHILNTYTSIFD